MTQYEKDIIADYGYAISRKDAAKLLGVSIPTFDRFTRDNTIKSKKVGHSVKVTPKTIVEYLGLD